MSEEEAKNVIRKIEKALEQGSVTPEQALYAVFELGYKYREHQG